MAQLADSRILAVLAKSIGITLVILFLAGWLGKIGLDALFEWAGLFAGFEWTYALTAVISFIAVWLLFRLVALAVLQFFADEIVLAVEQKHYPHTGHSLHDIPFREELRNSARSFGRALLVNLLVLPIALILLVTGIGTALVFWAANAWLLGRELQDMVWLRHRQEGDPVHPIPGVTRFFLGGVVAAMLLVPFLNLLSPVIGAAAATHLVHRRQGVPTHA